MAAAYLQITVARGNIGKTHCFSLYLDICLDTLVT